jgi:hypothetical protein
MLLNEKVRLSVLLVTILAIAACGGREGGTGEEGETGDDAGTLPSAPGPGGTTPIPTCPAICDHILAACTPGASDGSCVSDCETTTRDFAACSRDLDAYLVCMGGTKVECHSNEVVILDCSAERNQLEACVH